MTVAVEEFSKYDHNEVTVSKIVKEAGIPKGSFYQYFEEKFESLGFMYKAGVQFAMENPKDANLGSLLLKNSDKTLQDKIYGDMTGQANDFFGQFNMVFTDYFFNIKGGSDINAYVKDIDVMLKLFKNGVAKKMTKNDYTLRYD